MSESNLSVMLDALGETGVYVIKQDTHELLYFNRRVKEITPEVELGMKCHEIWKGTCANCPLITIGDNNSNHTIHYGDPFGEIVDILADKVIWNGNIPAYVITVTPHKLNYEEQQGREQIEKMYSKSLVTVFKECIIVNLTADFYVNCQKNNIWTDIPEWGVYRDEFKIYMLAVIHPEDRESFEASFSREAMLCRFEVGKKQISKRIRRLMEDGTYHMVEYMASQIQELGKGECWCVLVFRDVNEEYFLEQQINVEMVQLATAAKIAYQMFISVNLSKNTYYMMEYSRFDTKAAAQEGVFDDLIEVGISTLDPDFREEFARKFSRNSLLKAFSQGIQKVSMELRQLGDDGMYHWNSTQAVRINSPYTDDVLQITMSKNIDEERRQQEESLEKERKTKLLLEEALQKAETANQIKNDFLSKMSHDIRTPMNAIMGMTTLARIHIDDVGKLQEYLEKIKVSSVHLLGLINEILDVNKLESGIAELEGEEFNLCNLIEDSVLMVQPDIQRKEQNLTVKIAEDIHPVVLGDEQRFRQVLVNVVENASKYTEISGNICISLEQIKKDKTNMGTYQFTIEDNGIGMKEDYLKHIFEPFTRADDSRISKIPGTGLGLTIVHNIINMMGGDIKVESEYGRGTRFVITLCMEKREIKQGLRKKEEMEVPGDFSGMRVLLAEDNELNQQIAAEMLKYLGVEVEIAENGKEAVEAVLRNPPFYYDLVFMDIRMPVMNGCEATEKIRCSGKEGSDRLPIVAMTADAFSEDIKRTRLVGMNGHMTKPIDMERLRKALKSVSAGNL